MAKIQGRYLLYAALPATYELGQDDRNANFTGGNQDVVLYPKCLNAFLGGGAALFLYENNIKIKRARIVSRGARGIDAPLNPDNLSARFILSLRQYDDGGGKGLETVVLSFPQWNEWVDFNVTLRPYKTKADPWEGHAFPLRKPVALQFNYQNASFYVDDYNIEAAYSGQVMNTAIEMEVETAGIIDDIRGVLF